MKNIAKKHRVRVSVSGMLINPKFFTRITGDTKCIATSANPEIM